MSLDSAHILFFDDSRVVLDEIERTLRDVGYDVSTATTFGEACTLARKADIVVIDYHMPELDGGQALEGLRAIVQRTNRLTLFYLYTIDREIALSYKRLGFDGAFTAKGTPEALPDQVGAARRMLQLRRFRELRKNG